MKRTLTIFILILLPLLSLAENRTPKYVFLFIGDGMGLAHASAAEYYKGHTEHVFDSRPLSFTMFPVLGQAVTRSASNLITDSAAAGTALSTGVKTNNGMLGIAPDSTTVLTSIAARIHEAGYKVGISSTVGLNHATPAAFYARNIDRDDYYDIALDIPASGFEFFAGGGLIESKGKDGNKPSAYTAIENAGYTIAEGMDQYESLKGRTEMIMLLQNDGREKTELPYAIDMKAGDMSQKDLVEAAIDFLYTENGPGFFIMSESGRIDWASHANDTKAAILETISLSDAVATALKFYNEHPDETLIIVTADHETGGLTLSWEDGYSLHLDELDNINSSKSLTDGKGTAAMDEASHRAHIGWTSKDHSAVNVPVYAIGAGSGLFSGRMDNTEIPRRICKAMNITF
ncbi:MAG TPA: alkaline phosphatase [Candidatus Coprenecus stercoravium]|uniref:Alkaline phosphatase n=1 Tax=Candidatus Coprenecus stercoravium TaxID=2840735 RepID=A0A9D2GQL1_9BACT|nr:alkaline phosphatase [Candidatus Coprenecus stercoravium]